MTATSLDLSQIKTDALSSAATFRTLIGLGASDAVTFKEATLTSGTVTSSTPVINATQTWNDGATTFTGISLNVTNTASATRSWLMDLKVGGSSKFKIRRDGAIFLDAIPTEIVASNSGVMSFNGWNQGITLTQAGALTWSIANAPIYTSSDLFIRRDAANTLAQRNGVNPQAFNIYNTYTSSTSYERGFLRWNSYVPTGAVIELGSEAGAGGGSNRGVMLNPSNGFIYTNGTIKAYNYHQNQKIQANSGSSLLMCGATNGYQAAKFELLGGTGAANWNLGTSIIKAGTGTGSIIVGANLDISGGNGNSASSGDAHGGNVLIAGGTGYGTGHDGYVVLTNPPVSDPAVAGAIWNNGGIASLSNGGASYTTSTPFTINQTWNDGATTFTGILANITDTASASASMLVDFQVGGSSKFKIRKDGYIFGASASFSVASFYQVNGNQNRTVMHQSMGFITGAIHGGYKWTGNNSVASSFDLVLERDASDTMAQRRGTNAQTFRLYNTYTSGTSFERLNVRWATNELIIDAEAGSGGGTLRGIKLGSATTSLLGFYGVTPVDQPLTVADPAGGGTVDSEARTAIGEIIDRLQELGLIA